MIFPRPMRRGGMAGGMRWLLARGQDALGIDVFRTRDRVLLEDTILPWYAARDAFARVLYVGCDWRTRRYARVFLQREFVSMDPAPGRVRYGAATHIIGGLQRLDRFLPEESLDLIICNGVYGWGLNDRDDCEQAFDHCFTRLRPAGQLVLGWNDTPSCDPCGIDTLASLRRFDLTRFSPPGLPRVRTGPNAHTFAFFARPRRRGS